MTRVRPLAIPTEHGGWGFLIEPIIIGLIAVFSPAGLLLALAALAVFLVRHPLRIAAGDLVQGRRVARRPVAWMIAAGYAACAAVAALAAARIATGSFWGVLVVAAPLAAVQFAYDARLRSRDVVPELAGATALAGAAAAMALASGRPASTAAVLWIVAAARTLPAIITVRTRVQRLHGIEAGFVPAFVAHDLAVISAIALWAAGLLPPLVIVVLVVLAIRAMAALRPTHPVRRAADIGLRELITGLVSAAVLGAALRR